VLGRARALKKMRLDALQREAEGVGVKAGEKARKADWINALLVAEFPSGAARRSSGENGLGHVPMAGMLRLSGGLGLVLVGLAMALLPFGAWRLAELSRAGLSGTGMWASSTADTLRQSSVALQSASEALTSSGQALESASRGLDDAQPLLTSVGDVLGTQAPEAIATARQSLINAQSGAQAIDRVLVGLSLFGIGYNPDQPLAQGLADTADSLKPLPGALSDASDHLQITQRDLGSVSQDVAKVSADLADMASQLSPVAAELNSQADELEGLATALSRSADQAPLWIWGGTVVLELLLLIAGSTQYAVLALGRFPQPA